MGILSLLAGKKTYLCALALGVVTVAESLGYVDSATARTLQGLVGAGGLAALRAGVKKV